MNDSVGELFEASLVLLEIERFRLVLMRFIRFGEDEAIDHIVQFVQADFQQIQLVEKCEDVVNHRAGGKLSRWARG